MLNTEHKEEKLISKYLGSFDDLQDLLIEWTLSDYEKERIKKLDIIVAVYDEDGWDGRAFVLFKENGHLYEVNESHCSCNGLENWSEEETTKEALLRRLENRYGIWDGFYNDLKPIIESL